MTETVGLPVGDHRRVALDDLAEHRQVRLLLLQAVGVVAVQHVVGQLFELLVLAGVVEVFEVTEADMAGCQAQHHRRAFLLLAPDRGAGAGDTQRPRAGDAEGVQVFAGKEFADRAAQHRAAVAHARVGRLPGTFEVQIPVLACFVDDLAEQQAATIAQAWAVAAELMPGIDHGARLGAAPQLVPGKNLREHLAVGFTRVQVEQGHGSRAGDHQARLGNRLGQHVGGKGIAEAGETVVELQLDQRLHNQAPAGRSSLAVVSKRPAGAGRWRVIAGRPPEREAAVCSAGHQRRP